jgi:hypothetical protein
VALPYLKRMEREIDRLIEARRRLVHAGDHQRDDVRVASAIGKGQFVAAADLGRYQALGQELDRVLEVAPPAGRPAGEPPDDLAVHAAEPATTWDVGERVLIANAYGAPNPAPVMAENPERPSVVKVKYPYSMTALGGPSRVLGPAPGRTAGRTHDLADTSASDRLVDHVDAVRDPRAVELAGVTEPAPAARTAAAATAALPSPPSATATWSPSW